MSRAGACRYLSRRHAIVPVHVAAACRQFGLFSGVFLCRSQEPGLDDARVLLPGDPLDASIPQKSNGVSLTRRRRRFFAPCAHGLGE